MERGFRDVFPVYHMVPGACREQRRRLPAGTSIAPGQAQSVSPAAWNKHERPAVNGCQSGGASIKGLLLCRTSNIHYSFERAAFCAFLNRLSGLLNTAAAKAFAALYRSRDHTSFRGTAAAIDVAVGKHREGGG